MSRRGGFTDAFLVKMNSDGTSILYSTYLGGTLSQTSYGVAVDPNGNAYITGSTTSGDFPVTAGAFQTSSKEPHASGQVVHDAFVARFDPAKSGFQSLIYSTYLSGSASEYGGSGDLNLAAIKVDGAGSAYVTGVTQSNDFPTTPGAFRTV